MKTLATPRMRWMELFLTGLCVFFFAAVVHLGIILALPRFAADTTWEKMGTYGPDERFNILASHQASKLPLRFVDPTMIYAVCRFDLDGGPVRIRASAASRFWSVSIYTPTGRNIYSINNRSAMQSNLDITVATAPLHAIIESSLEKREETSRILIKAEDHRGFAVLRAFVPTPSQQASIINSVRNAQCRDALNEDRTT